MVVQCRKIGEYHPSIPEHLLGLITLGVCNNLQPKWRKAWMGEGVHLCSFLCPSEISLLIFLAFVSFPDLVLQFFSMQSKARPPTCIFFFPRAWYHQLLVFRTQFFCHLHNWLQCFGQFYMDD